MDFVYSEVCLSHNPPFEVSSGRWQPHSESPARLVSIHKALIKEPHIFNFIPHQDFGLSPILRVHSPEFVDYLQTAYKEWVSAGRTPMGVLPDSFPHPALVDHLPSQTWRASINSSIEAKVSTYAFDLGTMIVDGTWKAAITSANVALTAAYRLLELEQNGGNTPVVTYALCRPPGHHACKAASGGFCYLNNAAIAAQFFNDHDLQSAKKMLEGGEQPTIVNSGIKKKVLIVDVDYHHGNGTQSLFYDTDDVFYISLHAYPDYPYFTGSSQETGVGKGEGYNINIPIDAANTTHEEYLEKLVAVLESDAVVQYAADVVVVSLGFDTWCEDPVGGVIHFSDANAYTQMGKVLATAKGSCDRPILFVQEGGYTVPKLGDFTVNVLKGFLGQD
ncbi:hypothetical protein BGW37DRAFT_476196 [Umbelopsis sp. PMI_123]|nr:hypothetical protein BGW37DRAFT_476196 [Umbelopsis sp. PMI_123]